MRRLPPLVFACAAALALLIAACGGDSDAPDRDTGVEATRSDGGEVTGGYALEPDIAAARFDNMLGFEVVPGSATEAIVVTQGGQLWRVSLAGDDEPALFADVADKLIDEPGTEEGLLGFAFSPRFPQDDAVYLHYSAGEPRRSVVSRFRVAGATVDTGSEQVLLEVGQPYPNHNGGQLAFGPDGYLYVGLGDGGGGGDPDGNGQNPGTLLGAILRLDVSGGGAGYAIPSGNPFVGRDDARGEIFAYGFRNPWRFSFDPATGELWAGDVGQERWEEIDRVEAGGNYGWNIMEGFECYEADACDEDGLTLPRAAYSHDGGRCAIIGGHVYRGDALPELRGWYVYGDYCSGRVWALDTGGESEPRVLIEEGPPIASFGVLPDGELIAVTFVNELARLVRQP